MFASNHCNIKIKKSRLLSYKLYMNTFYGNNKNYFPTWII